MRRRAFLASSMAVVPLVAGCVGKSAPQDGGGGGGSDRKESATIEIADGSFSPKTVELAVGGTVTWKNTTDTKHEITAYQYQPEAASWQFPSAVDAGGEVEHTFEEAGIYQYYSMTGGGRYSMCGAVLVGDHEEMGDMC